MENPNRTCQRTSASTCGNSAVNLSLSSSHEAINRRFDGLEGTSQAPDPDIGLGEAVRSPASSSGSSITPESPNTRPLPPQLNRTASGASPEPTDECSTDEGGEEDVAATASENDHQQADEDDDDVDPTLEAVKTSEKSALTCFESDEDDNEETTRVTGFYQRKFMKAFEKMSQEQDGEDQENQIDENDQEETEPETTTCSSAGGQSLSFSQIRQLSRKRKASELDEPSMETHSETNTASSDGETGAQRECTAKEHAVESAPSRKRFKKTSLRERLKAARNRLEP